MTQSAKRLGNYTWNWRWNEPFHEYENQRKSDVSVMQHEKNWDAYNETCNHFEEMTPIIKDYIIALADIAGVASRDERVRERGLPFA